MIKAGARVALLHHMGGGNLGDDGTFDAVIQNIRKRWAHAEIVGLSMNPSDTQTRHGIASYPIRQQTWDLGNVTVEDRLTLKEKAKATLRGYPGMFRLLKATHYMTIGLPSRIFKELIFLARALRLLKTLDLLIVCGGGQLIESSGGPWTFLGGPWKFPYTIFKWVAVAKVAGVKRIILNIGAGPIVRPLTRFFTRSAFSFADYASFRDNESKELVHRIGVKRRTYVVCDSAYSLEIPALNKKPSLARKSKGVVGVAPMAFGDPRLSPKHDPAVYNDFIRQIATFATWLLKNGYCVTLFCTDIGIDPPAIQDIEKLLSSDSSLAGPIADGFLQRVHQWTTRELLANMSSMDYAVVCRFHAVVYAHLLNLPVLAINHHPKVKAQMNDLGLQEYCVDMDNCGRDELAAKFAALVNNRDLIKSRMADKLASYNSRLTAQFDQLFPPDVCCRGENIGHLGGTPGPQLHLAG